jgi:titin
LAQSVTPGSSYSINVGAGGATSQSVGGQAQDGGSSTFGTISAVGGGGGGSKNANGRGVIGAGGGGGGHANPGNGGTTLGGTPSSGADSFWGWSASNNSMVNNQGSVVQFSYIQASLTRTIPITQNSAVSAVAFNVNVDNSITNIIGWNGERIDTYSIRVELLNSSGTVIAQNSYSGVQKHALTLRSVSVTNSDAALRNLSVRITITGFDAGYWAGFYGPIFRTPSLTVNGVAFPEPGAVTGFGGGGASGSRAVGNGGGGGGAGGVGGTSATSAGGVGVLSTITNSYFGGGGGGGSWNNTGGLGGNGGGGNGGNGSGAICGNDGAPNTGGGGGAMGNAGCSNRTLGAGGSGVVVLRYAAANTNIELPAPDDYVVQYADISAASAPDLITNGLVLQYEANSYSGSGTTLTDARGNSNATLVNNPAYTATGGGYFTMIGSSSHYIMSNTSLNSQFTSQANRTTTSIFMWVYPTSANGILISEFGAADINAGWHDSQIEMVNGTMRFRVWNGANLASAIATPVNNWYYVGFVYNQATQTLTGYVNGQVAVTSTNYARQAPYDYGSNLHFGIAARDTTNLGNGGFGSFRFGSLHVYNSALTTAQVQQNFAAGCARFALCDASIYQNYQSYSWQTFTDGISPLERATVTNLLPGKRYIFRVASKNGVGTGSFTAASNPLEIRGAPGTAPTLGTITAGNQRAVVNFTAPTNTGGSPIIRYTARAVATGTPALPARECTWSTGALSCTINELANGRTYNVTVTASNSFGESQPSSALTVTPKTIPDAPTALSITSGAAQLALSWSAPTFDGGSPITGYKIERATGDSATWTVVTANTGSTTTTSTVTGLTNGTVYRIRITAINLVGESVPSEIATGTPRGAASAPLAPTGNGNNASAFITWSAPANNGSPITDYEVQYGTSATGPWTTFTDAVSSVTGATVTELTNGTAYYFQVRAINGAGNGAWSPSSAAITPATIPGAPTLTAITIPNSNPSGRLAIAFTAGVTGGSAITGYEFSINGGATWTALTGTSNLVIEGLTNGVSYAISLRAVNAQGVGPASNEVTAAPTGPADAPVISGVVAENQKLTVSFSAPANNGGSAITGYRYQIRGLSGVWSAWTDVTAQPLVITSLTNGVSYSVKLQAVNAGGAGVESVSVSGTPFTNPSAPTITSVTPGNGSLAIAYTVDTNGSTITATEYSLDAGTTWIRTTSATSPLTITGLVNGTSYTPQVRVINSAGEGPSVTATATTPFREPFAPAITSVSSTSTSITMNFTVNNGGSAVTTIGYRSRFVAAPGVTSCAAAYGTLTWSENWSSWSEIPAANSLTLSGLSTGNCYDVQVRAQNSAGYGPTSRESGKPVTVPSAPSIVAITPAAGALTVTFNESADNGGAAISAYEYRIGSGSWTSLATLTGFTLGSSTVFTLDSLTNGSSYAITLRAVNSAGASAASTAVTATPVTTPSAPTITSVAPLDGALRIAFTAPTSTGGSTILGYQYQLTVGTTSGAWTNAVITSGTTTFDINGLSNATTYSVSLRAINAQGNSATNTFATAVAPGKAPDAPSISAIIVGNQRLSIVVAPGLDGGWPLTNYEYSINDGAWIRLNGAPDVALANPIIVTGLTNGTAYQFRVRSVNGIGESPASTSVTQTPATTPTAPTILSISTGDGSLSVAFTAPTANGGNNGGSAITSYQYSVNGGVNWLNRQTGATASPLTITGLTNGVAYNVMIRAVNAIGVGAASNAEVKFPQVPGAGRPISVTTTPLDGAVRVAWTPPAAYVGAPIVGYRVNAIPGTGSCLWSTGEYNCTISGLTNGTSYTFTVTSQRTEVSGLVDIDTSIASATTVPRTTAAAPTAIAATGGGNEAALTWVAPTNNGGAAITDYRIEFSSDDGVTWSAYSDAISSETSATVDGLSPGTQYRFRVAAINAAGVGTFSAASSAAKTFERAPELTLTLDQQSADGFAFIMKFKDALTGGTDPLQYTLAATTNNPGATVEQVGDFFTVRGLTPGASVTVTVTAQRADYLQAIATIFSSALLAAPAPSLGSAEAIDGGFRLTVNGYGANTAAGFSYAVTSTAGAVIDDGDGVFRIVGLANGESAIATVTASRTGYATVSTSLSGSALALGVAAQIESITGTRDGFTFTIANYTPEATYTLTSSKDGSTVTRTNELVTVTGLTNLEMATITVKTVRTGYMDASIDVVGVALPQSEVNTLASLSLSNGALAFNASTYEYQLAVANTVTTFRVTPTKSDQDSTIAISINGGAAAAISSGTQSSALPLNVGVNTIVVAVTSQVGSVQNYTLYINRAKSPLSTLSALSLSAGTLTGFDSSLSAYEVNVPYNSSSITATATPSNSAATMQIQVNSGGYSAITSGVASSALALNVGNNTVRIEVTSEDGLSTTIYELTITRAGAANSQLGSLAISVGNMPTFSPSILNYEVIVPTGTTTATVTPTLGSGVTGSISVNGVELADGAQSQAITLTAGTTNQITIVVTASDGSSTPYIVNVKVDAPPVALALARSSVGTQSNVAFTVQPQISINDALSNRVLLNTSTVSVAITAGAGGQLIGTTTATAVRGLATFSGLGLRGVAGTTYTLTYSSGALTVATQQVTLTPGEAVALAFRAGSATVASGSALATPLQVAAVDGDGNTVTDYGSAITLAVGTGASLTGTTVQTPASGLATYSDLTLRGTVNPNYTITATSGTLTSATRNVAITFGSATTLAVTRATSGVVSGTAFTTQPQLTIRDSAGNVVTNATAEITISIANGVGGTLTGTTTITAVNGVANFTDLAMSGVAGTAYTVTYSATGLTSASETLTVTAGVPTRLQLATPAAGFNNGTAFNRAQPILRIQDATGNTVTSSTATVSVTISSGGVLLGTTSLAATSGIASFTNLGVFGVPGSVYTLTFASPGLTSATQTILLTSGASLVPTFGTPTPTFDGFTVQITNFSRIFNWTFSILEGGESARISLGSNGLVTVTGMAVGSSATISATTARSGFENGAATVTGSTLLAPLRPTFGATTSTATGFRVQVTNFDSSYAWGISASNGGTATISSTGLINVIDLSPGVSSDVTVTTTKSGRVSASATITGNAIGVESTSANTDISSNLLTAQTLYPLCAGGTYEQEGIANVNDRNSKSKHLCFNASSRLNASYIRNSAGFYTGDIGSKIVTGIQFTSGDSDRSRDPIIYTLFGCASQNSDCTPIVVNGRTGIDVLRNNTGSIQTFLNKSAFNYYKVTFGALRTSWTDSAQVAEVALIGTDALASGRTPLFGAITRTANGFTVPISNFSSLFTWRVSTNVGGAAIGSDGVVTVTGVPSATSATLTVNTSRAKYEEGVAAISGTSLNSALIPTFGPATPTADGFTAPITNYSADYTWSTEVTTGAATIAAGVLTVTGQAGENQSGATVVTNRANYGTGRAQVVASALAVGLTPTFGASISKVDGFTVQITNYSADFTWQVQTTGGAVASLSATGLITVSNLAPGVSALVNVTSSKVGALTVIAQTTGKAQIGAALTPRFALSTSTADGFTVQILNYDANYTWSGTAGAGETVTVSNTGLVTVSGVTTGRMTTATISAARSGYSTGSQTISGTAVAPDVDNVGGQDIQLQVPISATTSPSEVIVTIDIPVDAAPGSTQFTGSAVATDSVDQGLRTVKIGGTTGGTTVTTVSAPIAITIPASAGIGIPVYSPDGANWLELPLLASPNLPEGQEMGYFRYDDGTIVILTRKIGE